LPAAGASAKEGRKGEPAALVSGRALCGLEEFVV
jgi:hypothetical protein